MYALNLTGRAVLITPQEVLKKTGTNNNLDSGRLLPGIEIAELRFLRGADVLGSAMYAAMAAEKNRTVNSGNLAALQAIFDAQYGTGVVPIAVGMVVNSAEYLSSANRALWDAILWKYLAECVIYVSLPDNYVDFTSAGLQKQNPIGSALDSTSKTTVGPSLSDLKFLMDKHIQERIEPLRAALQEYLQENASGFPDWVGNRRAIGKMTAYVDLSIYRDQDDACGCVYRGNNPQSPGRGSSPCCDPNDPLGW